MPEARPVRLADVIDRFPDRELQIRRLALSDATFLAICEDYSAAAGALRRWEASSDPQAEERRTEYGSLLQSLEQEIRMALGPA